MKMNSIFCLVTQISPIPVSLCNSGFDFCSVLLSSHGPDGPELHMIDPSGVSWVRIIIMFTLSLVCAVHNI